MTVIVSYEIYSFKNGDWMLDSVHDDKNLAVHQGRMLVASPHHIAIRVIEESYNDETDKSVSKIIYKDQKGKEEEKPRRRPATTEKKAGPVKKNKKKNKKKKKNNFSKNIIILALSIGGIGLGLLALIAVLIAKFG